MLICVAEGGADPKVNPRLGFELQNAKSLNMPKANIDAAIEKALGKTGELLEHVVYEGYGPGMACNATTTTTTTNNQPTRIVHRVILRDYRRNCGDRRGNDWQSQTNSTNTTTCVCKVWVCIILTHLHARILLADLLPSQPTCHASAEATWATLARSRSCSNERFLLLCLLVTIPKRYARTSYDAPWYVCC
jgi:hypothetical protein